MQRAEYYLTPLLYRHIERLDRDLQSKISILENIQLNQSAGSRIEKVADHIGEIQSAIKKARPDRDEGKVKPLITDLLNFSGNIQHVMIEITDLDEALKVIDQKQESMKGVETTYLRFLDKLAAYNTSNPLTHIIDSNNQSSFIRVEDKSLDFTALLELFRPLIASYSLLTNAIESNQDLKTVLDVMRDQSGYNITVIRDAKLVLMNTTERLQRLKGDGTIVPPKYVRINKTDSIFEYNIGDLDTSYSVALEPSDVYEYMVELELDSEGSDSLSAIKADSITTIKDYVETLEQIEFAEKDEDIDFRQIKLELKYVREADGHHEHSGGDYSVNEAETATVISHDVYTKLYELTAELIEINKLLARIRDLMNDVLIARERRNYYLMYLAQVGLMVDIKGMTIYRYINRGILDYYRSTIDDIFDRMNRLGPAIRPSLTTITSSNRSLLDAAYFRTYHFYMLERMRNFTTFLIDNMTLKDVINIRKCTGPIFNDFVVFNHYKDILDSYYEEMQNKVSIYGRINDYGTIGIDIPDEGARVFQEDESNHRMVKGDYSMCLTQTNGEPFQLSPAKANEMRDAPPIRSKFNMVFDSKYPDNESISKYMSISTNISKQKGVMIMTYGYSGTGKTFTLFGKKPEGNQPGKKGLLQSAIEGIRARSHILFRAYEMYGAGLVYPFYWCDSVTEEAYYYQIDPNAYKAIADIKIDSLSHYVGVDSEIPQDMYIKIDAEKTDKFFANFSQIVESIDAIRKKKGRIKKTPNNPESSRSIIVYDILIAVKDELVKLTVIDLPGREEIVTTYTDDYISKHEAFDNEYDKAILSSIAINPLYLSILCPTLVFEAFNSLERSYPGLCQKILEQELNLEALDDCMKEVNRCVRPTKTKEVKYHDSGSDLTKKLIFLDEVVITLSRPGSSDIIPKTIGDLVDFNANGTFKMIPNSNANASSRVSRSDTIEFIGRWQSPKYGHMGFGVSNVQYQGVIAIHLLNRIILMEDIMHNGETFTKFDIFRNIYAYISDELGYEGLSDLAIAPFEGVYINENIVGLMKVLTTNENLLGKSQDIAMKLIAPQEFKSFKKIKKEIRYSNGRLYSKEGSPDTHTPFENIYVSKDELREIYESNKKLYYSQKIFRFCNPIIEDVMNYYIQPEALLIPSKESDADVPRIRHITDKENMTENDIYIGPTKDVKVFYLFSNNNQDLKCEHQYKLYRNTQGLMQIIDPVNN